MIWIRIISWSVDGMKVLLKQTIADSNRSELGIGRFFMEFFV
jgi:hypothetical protein